MIIFNSYVKLPGVLNQSNWDPEMAVGGPGPMVKGFSQTWRLGWDESTMDYDGLSDGLMCYELAKSRPRHLQGKGSNCMNNFFIIRI